MLVGFRRVLSFFFLPMVVIEEFYTYCDWLLMEVGSGFEVEVVVVIKFFLFVVVTGEFQREREISEKEIEEKASEF